MNAMQFGLVSRVLVGRVQDVRELASSGGRYALSTIAALYQRRRQRRALARLDERLLRDVGISPAQARRETGKSFLQE